MRLRRNILPFVYGSVLLLVLILAASLSQPEAPQEPPRETLMALPTNYQENFIHYATVDRVDEVTRRLYISPDALDQLELGEPLPDGARLVIEVYDVRRNLGGGLQSDANGHLIPTQLAGNIHMAEKRSTWQLQDLATSSRVGDWNFASFDQDTFVSTSENVNDCFTCHDTASRRDFVFSRPILDNYLRTGEVQHLYCNRPARAAC